MLLGEGGEDERTAKRGFSGSNVKRSAKQIIKEKKERGKLQAKCSWETKVKTFPYYKHRRNKRGNIFYTIMTISGISM